MNSYYAYLQKSWIVVSLVVFVSTYTSRFCRKHSSDENWALKTFIGHCNTHVLSELWCPSIFMSAPVIGYWHLKVIWKKKKKKSVNVMENRAQFWKVSAIFSSVSGFIFTIVCTTTLVFLLGPIGIWTGTRGPLGWPLNGILSLRSCQKTGSSCQDGTCLINIT